VSVSEASGRPAATSFYLFLLGRKLFARDKLAGKEAVTAAKDVRHLFARVQPPKASARHACRSSASPPWTRQ
jgi:hypothetical protein